MPTIGNTASGDSGYTLGRGTSTGDLNSVTSDGWITAVHARVGGFGGTTDYRLALWDGARDRVYHGPIRGAVQGEAWKVESGLNIRTSGPATFWIGVHCLQTQTDADRQLEVRFTTAGSTTSRSHANGTNSASDPLGGSSFTGDPQCFYVDYVNNVAPTTPTWRTPSADNTTVNATTTIQGNLNQGADDNFDTINSYELQVYRKDTGAFHTNTTITTSTTERSQGYFSRSLSGLAPGVAYGMKFKTIDSFGTKSAAFSAERTFNVRHGPDPPTLISPNGKQNTLSGYNYVGTYNHLDGTPGNRVQIIVTNAAGATLYDSGSLTVAVNNGANFTVPEFHTDLTYGSTYQWKARASDDAGANWGEYSQLTPFFTPSPPLAPTSLSPSGNQFTPAPTFTASVTDPDGDLITAAQIEIAVVSTGALVAGYTGGGAAMGVNAITGQLTYTPPPSGTGSLTLGTAYKWRCRASDGLAGYGVYSEYATFTYASGPTAALVAPVVGRSNMISQPSAEYDPVALALSNFWTVTNGGAGQSINRIADDNSPYGAWQWQGVVAGTGTLIMETTNFIAIDGTKSLGAAVWARNVTGTPLVTFSILCYNAASTLTGTLTPTSAGGLSAATPAAAWTRYGGGLQQIGAAIGTPLPAATTKIKIRISATGTGTFAFDAFSLSQLVVNPTTTTERDRALEWFGYADGDTQPMGSLLATDAPGYSWTGVHGDSPSSVLPILTKAASQSASVVFTYSSPTSSAKTNDRLLIERYRNGVWLPAYDSNPTWATINGNRTVIPLPGAVLTNEERFRLKVLVRDTALVQGETSWVEFETYYTGPAQIEIQVSEARPELAQIYLSWSAVGLVAGAAFAGIEVERLDLSGEEPRAIIGVITNAQATEFIDHFPAAGRNYQYRVRQIEQIGLDQVGGLWSTVEVSCNYYPYSFVKDVEDPTLIAAYETVAENMVGYSEDAPVGVISPWGAERPTVLTRSKLRIRTGAVTGAFFPDAGWEFGGTFPTADDRFDAASQIIKRRKTVCVLIPAPEPRKVFAAIMGEARTTFPYPPLVRGFEFSWQEVSFSEDYYQQAGLE